MRELYLEYSGISGDMSVAALLVAAIKIFVKNTCNYASDRL
ncbi:MAG: hypothetical protein ACLT33_04795 [Lachnospira pectinoschiza]